MKIFLLFLYLVIACPLYIGLLLLFPVFKIIDLGTMRIRWRLTLRIYEREDAAFNNAYTAARKEGIFIDFPPERPTKAMTSLELLRHLIGIPINDIKENNEEVEDF